MLERAGLEALAVGLDDERRAAVVLAVGLREDDVEVGDAGVRDPVLLAVDDPLVAGVASNGARAQRGRIGSGLRLGQRERRAPLAAGAAREEALLLLVAAEELDRQRAELLDHEDERRGRARLGDLLDRHLQHERAGSGAAVLLLERQAEDVVLGEQLADVRRVLRRAIDLGGARSDPLLREPADHVAKIGQLLGDVIDIGGRCRHGAIVPAPTSGLDTMARGHTVPMGIGTSIFLIALGAILKFAVTTSVSGIELATVGVILMVVGIIGLLISLMYLSRAGRGVPVARERVVERDPYI